MARIAPSVFAVFALSLSACAAIPPANHGGPLPPSMQQCDADPAQWAIGQPASAATVEKLRVQTHSRMARVLRPGQMVTMEYSAERVNIRVDTHNLILAITCG